MNSTIQANIKCPFFVSEKKNMICCEGFIDGTCMTTRFSDTETKIRYAENHCYHINGGACHMANDLFEKYKKLEEKEKIEYILKYRYLVKNNMVQLKR